MNLFLKRACGTRGSRIAVSGPIKIGGDEEVKEKKGLNRIKSTKYTLITFLPQNLLEQFRRIANFYFLVMSIISLLIDGPVSPMTSLLPLVFVIAVTAIKQGYEDFLRYKTDNIVNNSPVTVIRNGIELHIHSQDIAPGDLVAVERDCDVPCDLVLLRSTDPHGKCFVTTANLDGETNLKTLLVPRELPRVEMNNFHKLGIIKCESPKTDLYSFNGKIELTGEEAGRGLPLSAENVLLQGSRVKNTECVIGCAVYTGMTTKMQLNSCQTRCKTASSEIYINRFLIFILVSLIAIVAILDFLKRYNELFVIPNLFYLGPPTESYGVQQFVTDCLSFFVLFNYLIPISLYVTIEMHRFIGSLFMEWDTQLYDKPTDNHCIVNTSNLNEELGQINILFSDKTGTLTKNEMIFQQCSINGRKYIYRKTRLQEESSGVLFDFNKFNNDQKNFFQGLAICHTIQVAGIMNGNAAAGAKKSKETKTQVSQALPVDAVLAKTYAISTIAEESHDASQQIDDSLNNSHIVETSLSTDPAGAIKTTVPDVNSLQRDSEQFKRRNRSIFAKRSSNFAGFQVFKPTSSKGNGTALGRINSAIERPVTSNCVLENPRRARSISLHFKPSTTAMNLPAHNGFMRRKDTISRESYAAPSFQRQPTILKRAESQRRKNEIDHVVHTLDYQASSPDEKALVEASAHLGIVYLGDDDEVLKLRIVPPHMDYSSPFSVDEMKDIKFDRLHILEFTSDRKRMSVIVKDENSTKWIYTKGAESYVFPLCAKSSTRLVSKTDAHISEFAKQGLRTLAVARKRVTEAEYEELLVGLNAANSSLENRKELSQQCYAKVETNLDLLGATAVEDALQDEVADTLISLQRAGIKIWVLTGDKVETALNIALSCGHIPPNAKKYFITGCACKEDMLVHLNALDTDIICGIGHEFALLIDGKSLSIALSETANEFRDVAIKCTAVLCCRLSPLQKSEVVALIKTAPQNYNTAAIGDGANDVSMIQEAHIGVGIMGKEGRQAARCADFAFAKFCLLKRLLLVHGHYHTTRLSLLVLYFFYKNILFMGIMFLFQFHTLYSSSSIYDSFYLTFYNVIYTSVPIFFISLTEKPFSEETLMRKPELYKRNTHNKQLHWPYFLNWTSTAVYHALICFYFAFLVFSTNDVVLNAGQTAEFSIFRTLLIQMVIIVANLKLWIESKYLSYWYIVTIVGSILFFMITTVIYNVIDLHNGKDIYNAYNRMLSSIPLWLFVILTTIACLLPDLFFRIAPKGLKLTKQGNEQLETIEGQR